MVNVKGFHLSVCVILFLLSAIVAKGQDIEYLMEKNIPYYSNVVVNSDAYISSRCKLDVYYPVQISDCPVVVWFHGGGLTSGNKEIPEGLQKKGIVIVSVNYRLTPAVGVKQCVEDAAQAVDWVMENIQKYHGAPSKIFVSGHSAGAYLALMVGLDKSYLRTLNSDPDSLAGIIALSGQTITHFAERKALGYSDLHPLVDQMAPLFHVRKMVPPLVLITGDRNLEMLGRYEENAYLWRMMLLNGNPDCKLFELQGYGHLMTEPAFPLLINQINEILTHKSLQKLK
jgi:acetyl esterase/lipase